MNVLVSASAESIFMRGGSTNSDKDTNSRSLQKSKCSKENGKSAYYACLAGVSTEEFSVFDDFFDAIENKLTVDTRSATKCTRGTSGTISGGDCSQNPTYCSSIDNLDRMKAVLLQEIEEYIEKAESDIKSIESEKAYLEGLGKRNSDNNIVECRASGHPAQVRGSCPGLDSCMNLDFICAPSAPVCEVSCSGKNSCNGLVLHCAAGQRCDLKCLSGDSCVGAEIVYQGWSYYN